MKSLTAVFLFLCMLLATSVEAKTMATDCSAPANKAIAKDTTVFFYQRVRDKKTYYVPVMIMKDGKLSGIGKQLMPAEMTLYSARDDQPIKVNFKGDFNTLEMACQSIGEGKNAAAKRVITPTQLYANKPMSSAFNYRPGHEDLERFDASVKNPCKAGQAPYDKNGVAVCNSDQLLVTSDLVGAKQYWKLQQYRHDVGLTISIWNEKAQKFEPVVEDCTLCID